MTAIFDIRITDVDAKSHRSMSTLMVLQKHEREKKDKYLQPCLDRRRHFTPLVFSVDGAMGPEADAAVKRLSSLLADKWRRQYLEVCGFVRSRLSLALARATSMCIRGARDPSSRVTSPYFESGTGLSAYN